MIHVHLSFDPTADALLPQICTVWQKLYKVTFLSRALTSAQQCRKAFYHRNIACNAVECNDVVLFWRATRMLEITSNALRLQIMNTEGECLGTCFCFSY